MRKCPICGGEKRELLYKAEIALPQGVSLDKCIEVVCCSNCGFCYSNTNSTQKDFDNYYKEANVHMDAIRDIKMSGGVNIHVAVVEIVEKYVDKNARILDMGCGRGDLLYKLKDLGYNNLFGIDVTDTSIAMMEKKKISGCVGNICQKPIEQYRNYFDVVILSAVLEHMLSVRDVLENVKGYLKEAGKLFIIVPDIERIEQSTMNPFHHFHQEHINYFSVKSLDRAMSLIDMNRVCARKIMMDGDAEDSFLGVYSACEDVDKEIFDNISKGAISRYILKYQKEKEDIENKVKEIIEQKKPIVFWGIGTKAMGMLTDLGKICQIELLVDGAVSKQGKVINIGNAAYQISSPNTINSISKNAIIIVCVNSKKFEKSILQDIKEKNFDNEVVVL